MPTIDPPLPGIGIPVVTDHTLPNGTWIIRETTTGGLPVSDDHIQIVPFDYPPGQGTFSDIESVLSMLNGIRQGINSPDPIQINHQTGIDRQNPPEKPIFLYFDADAIKVYEEDAGGTRHLRFTIRYDKVNSVLVVSKNNLITAKEAESLDLVTELRSTQASLHESATALRTAQAGISLQKDQELAKLQAEKRVLEQKYHQAVGSLKLQERLIAEQEGELAHIKKQIADRQKQLDHLEID
jgi:hypothetical protein